FWGNSDIRDQSAPMAPDANDSSETLAARVCCDAQRGIVIGSTPGLRGAHEPARFYRAARQGSSGAARRACAAAARRPTGNAMRGITEWLASIGPGEHAPHFAHHAIALSVLPDP